MGATPDPENTSPEADPATVPVIEETVKIETRTVPTGTVRVAKHVETHTERLDIPVTRQTADVRRVRVDREVSAVPPTRTEGDTLIIPVVEEEVTVSKRLVLREEIRVTTRTVKDTVERDVELSKESVEVERDEPRVQDRAGRNAAESVSSPHPQSVRSTRMARNVSVLGIYRSRPALERGVADLRTEGFGQADISVLFPEGAQTKAFAHEKGTKAPEGATAGAGSGLIAGGVLGWLIGIGSLAIPGLGPFIAAGPIMAALAGAGVGGAIGTITGALIGMGIPEYEAKRYEGRVKEGGILISIHCSDSDVADTAEDILERTGAQDISKTGEASADTEAHTTPRAVATERASAGRFDADEDYREHYNAHYADRGVSWDAMNPAYRFGARFVDHPRFRGRSWSEVEPEVRTHYLAEHPNGTWDRVKDAVRYGWESTTMRRAA